MEKIRLHRTVIRKFQEKKDCHVMELCCSQIAEEMTNRPDQGDQYPEIGLVEFLQHPLTS